MRLPPSPPLTPSLSPPQLSLSQHLCFHLAPLSSHITSLLSSHRSSPFSYLLSSSLLPSLLSSSPLFSHIAPLTLLPSRGARSCCLRRWRLWRWWWRAPARCRLASSASPPPPSTSSSTYAAHLFWSSTPALDHADHSPSLVPLCCSHECGSPITPLTATPTLIGADPPIGGHHPCVAAARRPALRRRFLLRRPHAHEPAALGARRQRVAVGTPPWELSPSLPLSLSPSLPLSAPSVCLSPLGALLLCLPFQEHFCSASVPDPPLTRAARLLI